MADDDGAVSDDDDIEEKLEKLKKARRLQELFKGRFLQIDAIKILKHNQWDLTDAVNFCFKAEPQTIRNLLSEEKWPIVVNCRRDNVLRENAIANVITVEIRQFACQQCDNVWWYKVPTRKKISRCKKCFRKYDALERDEEWGWAVFQCDCGNEFHGFGAMNKTVSFCYVDRCGHPCRPVKILPPSERKITYRRSRDRHSCTAPNCYNRRPGPQPSAVNICVHPKSLRNKVVSPSRRHESSGSTVKTFLTQDGLVSEGVYVPSLADIDELD